MKKEFFYSLKHSLPILVSFIPVGIVYGVLMSINGYNAIWSAGCSLFVFAGSLQYLMIDFMTGTESYLTVAVMAFILNSRHIFYGIPFIEKWKDYGICKYFLIFALPDEAFSLHISNEITDDMNEKYVFIFNALLTLLYWVVISLLGGLLGSLIVFNTDGMDFALTALFIVIVIEQYKASSTKAPFYVALISSLLSLIIFGPSYFILPSLLVTVVILLVFKEKIEVRMYD